MEEYVICAERIVIGAYLFPECLHEFVFNSLFQESVKWSYEHLDVAISQ